MEHLEKVEKLRAKANITYEEAKAVLEECDWDLLDAVVKLEADGKILREDTASFSTDTAAEEEHKSPQQIAERYQNYHQSQKEKTKGAFRSLWDGVKYLLKKGCDNKFITKRHGEVILDIPVLLLIILMLAFFWLLLILMIVGLFFGFSYSFAGPELGREDINNVMGKAAKAAEDLKAEVKEQQEKEKNDPQRETAANDQQ